MLPCQIGLPYLDIPLYNPDMAQPKEGVHNMFAQIPVELWHALNADAEQHQRSATGQLIWILRQQYPDAIPGTSAKPRPRGRGRK